MADQSPIKLSPTAGAFFMPGAVQTPSTNESRELEYTQSEFSAQNHEISSIRSVYDDSFGETYHPDPYGGSNYGENYNVVENHYDNGQYGTNYYPEYNNSGISVYGDNGFNNYGPKAYGGEFKKTKGYKNKNKNAKNKPQYSNQPTPYYNSGEQFTTYYPGSEQHAQYYMGGEQPYYTNAPTPYPCEQKRKALAEGMTLICVGCGAFGKHWKEDSKGHNWTSLGGPMDYSNYLNAPICPHGNAPKKQYGGDRQMGKKYERSEGHAKKQPTHSNKSNNALKQDHETQTSPANVNNHDNETQTEQAKLNDRDNETQTSPTKESHETQTSLAKENQEIQTPVAKENRETQTSPTSPPAESKTKSRPNSLVISGWSATIPLQLQNVIDNIPALHEDGKYDAHDRIKSAIGMFEEFVKEYETVLAENKVLKSQTQVASREPKEGEELEKKMGEMSDGDVKEKEEVKGAKE